MSSPALVPDTPARVALRRPTEGRMIAGVASGLAEHLRMPVGVVRTTFVVLSFLSGAGLLAYGVLWVLVPRQREQEESAGLEAASRRGCVPWSGPSAVRTTAC
ncbi:PspC domain-containing protein [Tessaracoccus defluvii]|uniref:PspC domain-containing protein n=1 Tax=Tessaracoccus defluvii TaxID=1285901 RepID=A0A7H0H9X0_9ACTN|nr:PspC domain-containing protein [Tessaracoccus defluvii]QNP57336.1 PspC domain-containing protein [Tessaracoccus defluvii]